MKAPSFSLQDQDGKVRQLSDFKGKWLILYFYPKDDTPGCTKEACGFRDSLKKMQEKGAMVVGVSKDSIASHKKFAEKFQLNFLLLSDPEKNMVQAYKAWGPKKFLGKEFFGSLRITHLINPEGEIVKTYNNVNPTQHADEILTDLISYTSRS